MQEDDASDVAVPEKIQSPTAGNQHLNRHEKGFVEACLYHMFRQDIDPEETVNKSAVEDKKEKAGDKERPGVLCEAPCKSIAKMEYRIKHEGFGNAITDAEYQDGHWIKSTSAVGGGV